MLELQQLTIERVVVHHIPPRDTERRPVEPIGGEELVELPISGADMMVRRLAHSLGSRSHGLKADFRDVGPGSVFQAASEMMECPDARFIELARQCATQLAAAQAIRPMNPCKLISICGKVSALERPYVAFIKADLQDALTEKAQRHRKVLDHLRDIFMTESQRLYKIGFIQRTVAKPSRKDGLFRGDQHQVYLFDHLLTGVETRQAAFYFYSQFLGADLAMSDKRLTRDFYEKTVEFFRKQGYAPDRRIELVEALRSELRSNEQTISVAAFGAKYLAAPDNSAYSGHMQKAGFPEHAITKDVEYVKSRLRKRRKFTFDSGVQITTPADAATLVTIRPEENGITVVEVQGKLESSD